MTTIHLIKEKATSAQILEMLEALDSYIKLAVDIEKKTLAGGGTLHADCESVLLEDGSMQKDIWGADWIPFAHAVTFESLINIRPNQSNYTMQVADLKLRDRIESIVRSLLEQDDEES